MALNRVSVLMHKVVELRLIFGVIASAAVMHAGYRPPLMLCLSLPECHLQSLNKGAAACHWN